MYYIYITILYISIINLALRIDENDLIYKSAMPVVEFLRCSVGDGRAATCWFDWWTDLGPLISDLGGSGPRDLRIPIAVKCV